MKAYIVKTMNLLFRMIICPTTKGGWPFVPLKYHLAAANIWKLFLNNRQQFGVDVLYQAFEPIDLPGLRPSQERLSLYGLSQSLPENSRILDIGSNMGCIGNLLASSGHSVVGVEYNETLVHISNIIKNTLNLKKATFIHESFTDFSTDEQFDCILALAVHRWIPMEFDQFIGKVSSLLKKDSLFVFESNNYSVLGNEFEVEADFIEKQGFEKISHGTTHYECERKFYIFQKK